MKTVLILGIGLQKDWCKAFQEHYNVVLIDYTKATMDEILFQLNSYMPDFVFAQVQFNYQKLHPSFFQHCINLNIPTIIWNGDYRHNIMEWQYYITCANLCTLPLLTHKNSVIQPYVKKQIEYLQIGFNKDNNYPIPQQAKHYKCSFIGNNYGEAFTDGLLRKEIIEYNKDILNVSGSGYSFESIRSTFEESNIIYNQSQSALSISNYNSIHSYHSDRLLHITSTATPCIVYHFTGAEELGLMHKHNCYFIYNKEELKDAIDYCINNKEIGMNGFLWAQQHTYSMRVLELKQLLNKYGINN